MQMVQFVIGNFGLGLVYFYYYYILGRPCSGEFKWGLLSTFLTTCYFILFGQMYRRRYLPNKEKEKAK